MATETHLKALRGIGQRLNELAATTTGKPILLATTANLSIEELVFLVEEASEKIPNEVELRLLEVIKRLKGVEESLAGSASPFQFHSLEQKVIAVENVATLLEIKLKGSSDHQVISQGQEKKEESKVEIKREESKVEVKREESKKEPKREEPRKEEPKKEEVEKEEKIEGKKEEKNEGKKEEKKKEDLPEQKVKKPHLDKHAKPPTEVIFSGELEKIGKGMFKKWQKRKFYLTKSDLQWFSPHDGTIRNILDVAEILKAEGGAEGKHKKKWPIELETRKKLYHLSAPDEASHLSWIQVLGKIAEQNSRK